MKRYYLLGALVMGLVGCEQSQTIEKGGCGDVVVTADALQHQADAGTDASDAGNACLPYVETVLPASGMGDLVMLCSVLCDDGKCDGFGDPCPSYGDPCDFNGAPGVCVGCCNGPTGELHCSAIP